VTESISMKLFQFNQLYILNLNVEYVDALNILRKGLLPTIVLQCLNRIITCCIERKKKKVFFSSIKTYRKVECLGIL